MVENKKLSELLVEQRIITSEQLNEALEAQNEKENPLPIGEILIHKGMVTENDLLKALGNRLIVEEINFPDNDYQTAANC